MFLAMLKENQKIPFLKLAHKLMDSDGTGFISPEEKIYLEIMMREMGINVDIISLQGGIGDLKIVFPEKPLQKAIFLELIGLAFADSEFHKNERAFLMSLRQEFVISEEESTKLEDWVRRQLDLYKEAKVLLDI